MSARTINFTLNGEAVSTAIEPHRNLVELLQRFDLFGARESCGQGLCGCCTVLVDGKAVSGCLYFAIWVDGKSVSTVERLDADGALSNVQQAFIECGAFQCGFCTPGFVMMAHQLLKENPDQAKRISATISQEISAAAPPTRKSSTRCGVPRRRRRRKLRRERDYGISGNVCRYLTKSSALPNSS
ncbi:MAG: 2Fe-2S iron-sulfur cluster-binding protein [Xanthobacteraceae bacterium]